MRNGNSEFVACDIRRLPRFAVSRQDCLIVRTPMMSGRKVNVALPMCWLAGTPRYVAGDNSRTEVPSVVVVRLADLKIAAGSG